MCKALEDLYNDGIERVRNELRDSWIFDYFYPFDL